MKMRPSVLKILLSACCLISLVLNGTGELLILQEPERAINNTVDAIRYTCISEDDRTALVWNNDLKYYDQKQHVPKEFQSIQGTNIITCALTGPENCTAYWKKSVNWTIVNSRDRPTGPVLDSRWEDFAETSFREANHDHKNYQYVMKMTESSNVVFSVRGSQNINIRICGETSVEMECLTVTLRTNRDGSRKRIGYCTFTDFGEPYEQACIDTNQTGKPGKILFSEQLWRTFILNWNVRYISVCNEFRCLFEIPVKQNPTLQDKYLFMNMGNEGLMRFHFYDYLLMTREGTRLTSDKFYNNEQSLCFEFITGLCDECYLEIYVVDVKGISRWLTNIHRNHSFAIGGMLTWQRVKLNKISKHDLYVGLLSFKVITRLNVNENNPQPQWAIDTLRKCKSFDARRELTFKKVDSQISSKVRQVHYCQKMSYITEESSFVSSYSTTASNYISASTQKYLRKTSYSQAPCLSNWWERTSICDQFGCVCIEKISNSVTTGPKLLGVTPEKTNFGLDKTSNFSLREVMRPKSIDGKTLLEQTETWLVILLILVICLLFPYLVIWYRRHKKSQVEQIHLQGDLSNRLFMIPENSRLQSSRAQDLSSGPINTKISENVKKQTMHVHNVSSEPVNLTISDDSSKQKSHKQNLPLDPLYLTPIDPWEQTNNLRKVPFAPVYSNIPNNVKEKASHEQDILSDPVYTMISENFDERTMHVHDISSEPVYLTILDDSSKQTSHEQNLPLDPLYLTPIDPRKQINNAQEISLAPVYSNIPNNVKEKASHEQDILSDPVYTMISENFDERTMHVHDVSSEPVYLTILDDSSNQTSHKQNVSLDPPYLTPFNPRKQTSNVQEVSLAPVYSNIPNNFKEKASREQDASPFPVI